MNIIFSLVQFLTFHSFLSLIRCDDIPLIFNTSTHEIYPNWESVPENGGPYAIACPATYTKVDQAFVSKYSLDNRSILVQHGVEKKIPELNEKRCPISYRLSAALHSPPNTEPLIEFGYEVFFDSSWSKIISKESVFKDFYKIEEQSLTKIRNENDPETEADRDLVMKIDNPDDTDSDGDDEESTRKTEQYVEMGFVWLSRILVRCDAPTLSMKNVTYYLDKTIDKSKLEVKCDVNALGYKLYGKKRLCGYYTLGLVSCSELTTIPLWYETIENSMNYLEKFLISVVQVVPNKLKITLGVHDTLSFPAVEGNEQLPLYLDMEKGRFPVPKIIFRIVSYQFHHECESTENSCWFEMVIVIHNQPEVSKDDIICEDRCKKWGWDSIQYLSTTDKREENKSQFVYCCELNDKLRTLLHYMEDTHKKEDLDLKQFPYDYNENTKEIQKKSIQKEIEDKMDELLQ